MAARVDMEYVAFDSQNGLDAVITFMVIGAITVHFTKLLGA